MLLLALSGIQVHRLWVRLSGRGCTVGHVNMDAERPHNVHANEAGQRLQAHNDNEAGPTTSFAPLYIQVLGFTGNLQWFAVCIMHCALKLL